MRIKVTDFGSAKILGRKEDPSEVQKRSFVGSAEYVSPEVLSDLPVSFASDIWGFGVVLYNFITGSTPFRSATEFLTFQKVLHRELTYPEGFDEQAKNLIDSLLDPDPAKRPTSQEIKAHPFFASIDWGMLWQVTPPTIHTGLVPPQQPGHMTLDSDVWAAFEDDDDADEWAAEVEDKSSPIDERFDEHRFNAGGVRFPYRDSPDESTEDLDPPRPAWLDDEAPVANVTPGKKTRGWSTSSSSSGGGRLSIWLESMGINTPPGRRANSSRASRYSDRSDDRPRVEDGARSPRTDRSRATSPAAPRIMGVANNDNTRW
jgi:3-phosphoinositide dependent protein kinase-1